MEAMNPIRQDAAKTLISIARCPNLTGNPDPESPCGSILVAQDQKCGASFQVPEPWRGDIVSAPLLFVSSNPSYDPADDNPTSGETDVQLVDYFHRGFPETFPKILNADGTPRKQYVRFWVSIRALAAELYSFERRSLKAGRDFAITEVVRCKSRHEEGVEAAVRECVTRHFRPTMELSQAEVVVVLGSIAQRALGFSTHEIATKRSWYGRIRHIVTLPHPNARCQRTFASCYKPRDLQPLRDALSRPQTEASCIVDPRMNKSR